MLRVEKGSLVAFAPYDMPVKHIEQFIASRSAWIEKHLAASQEAEAAKARTLSAPPRELPLLGRMEPVIYTDNIIGHRENSFCMPEKSMAELKPYAERIYKQFAKSIIIPEAWKIASEIGAAPELIRINSAVSHWGSCSGHRTINISWRTVCADPNTVRYVIIHELCHLTYMDHSDSFWALVERYDPHHKEHRNSLRRVTGILSEYGLDR